MKIIKKIVMVNLVVGILMMLKVTIIIEKMALVC